MKPIILFIAALLYPIIGVAQMYYYLEPKTFHEEGYTYQCDINSYIVTLYNKENKLTYEDNIDKRTGYAYVPNGKGPHIAVETWTKPKCFSIVNQAFSPKQKAGIKGKELAISLCISPQTGKIVEVYFAFVAVKSNPYTTIPISVFRQIEVELKKNVWFVPTEEGKNMSYILLSWGQDPNETIQAVPGEDLDGLDPVGGGSGEVDENPVRGDDGSTVVP